MKGFQFRQVHPRIFLGTASDRYAGWIGQVYTPRRYDGRITKRSHAVGGKSYTEEVLPVESVEEYFQHFGALELDYTFYRPLLTADGEPTENHFVLGRYREHLKEGDRLLLKVPQGVLARKIRRHGDFAPNPDYLNPKFFTRQFYEPAMEILGPHLCGLIFEQEYQRKDERTPPEKLAAALDQFFGTIPADLRYHVELRTESYLDQAVLQTLERHGVGLVLSHWTWLPPLLEQFERSGRRFLNAGGDAVVRLMTPHGMRYEDAYARAFPFDRLVDGLASPAMVGETVALMREAVAQDRNMYVIVNNRSAGNAPLTISQIAEKFV